MNIIFLNNQFIAAELASINIGDRGFLLADGLFETMRIYKGHAIFLTRHYSRLTLSAKKLAIPLPLTENQLQNIIKQLLTKNNLTDQDAIIRLTLTRGHSERGLALTKKTNPTLLITTHPYQPSKNQYTLKTSHIHRNEHSPLANIKSLNYLDNILAYQEALNHHYDDALLLNTQNKICCTTTANLFILKNHQLLTPKIADGALPGITREIILEIAPNIGLTSQEKTIDLLELNTADDLFITNSIKGIVWITQIDNIFVKETPEFRAKLLQALSDFIQITQIMNVGCKT